MKTLMNWLGDPCVHLIVIGLILIRLTMGGSSESNPQADEQGLANCNVCHHRHDPSWKCVNPPAQPLAVRLTR